MATGAATHEAPDWGVIAEWHDLIQRADPRFTLLSTLFEMAEPMTRLERSITVSMWNMQRHENIRSMRGAAAFDASLRRRGVELRFILPRRVVDRRCPLVSSHDPGLRVAPVAQPLLIADGRLMLIGDSTGETVWTSTDPEVVGRAIALYERVWATAVPAVPDGEEPPFTRRMVDIAFHLVDGASDREIARALGISERTVSSDVREMSVRLGARSRAQAIARISGGDG